MAWQATFPASLPFYPGQQSYAQLVISQGTSPAAGTWQSAPRPQAVNLPPPVGYPVG